MRNLDQFGNEINPQPDPWVGFERHRYSSMYCLKCGASIVVAPEVAQLHRDWHEKNDV